MSDKEYKSYRQSKYEKNGPQFVSMRKVRQGQGEYVKTVINLSTRQAEEHYRILSSGTLVKVCRKATENEIKEEECKQQAVVFDRIRKEYFRRHPEMDTSKQTAPIVEEIAPVSNEDVPVL